MNLYEDGPSRDPELYPVWKWWLQGKKSVLAYGCFAGLSLQRWGFELVGVEHRRQGRGLLCLC